MTSETESVYDNRYKRPNFFQYREWIYRRYIAALVAYCGLEPGSTVLDVGCGQGFFSYLLWRSGMRVHGVDISEVGVRFARENYAREGITFEVADIESAQFQSPFDCVFVRSCSLYNTPDFSESSWATGKLVTHLKPGGTFLFLYNSNFSGSKNEKWHYHSIGDLEGLFRNHPGGQCFFSSRVDAWLLGKYAFNMFVTNTNIMMSRFAGTGGDLIYTFKELGLG